MSTKPLRTPDRAKAIIDRYAERKANKPGILDAKLGDPQVRNPGAGKTPFAMRNIHPEIIKSAGQQDIPLAKVRSEQPYLSVAAVKGKIDNAGARPPSVIQHNGLYYVNDGNHRITAARALGHTSIRANVGVFDREKIAAAPAIPSKLGKVLKVAGPAAIAAGAAVAYASKARAGGTALEATAEAARSAGKDTAQMAAWSVGLAGAMKAATAVGAGGAAQLAARAVLPLSVAGHAAGYAYGAYQRGEGAGGIAKAAGWGAVNGLVPIDLATEAVRSVRSNPARGDAGALNRADRITPDQASRFAAANAAFVGRRDAGQPPQADHDYQVAVGGRGWANPATQAAAQAALGHKYKGPTG